MRALLVSVAPDVFAPGLRTFHAVPDDPAGSWGTSVTKDGKVVPTPTVTQLTTLEEAIAIEWDTLAQAVCYRVEGAERIPRLRKDSLPQLRAAGLVVLCDTIWLDLDLHHLLGLDAKTPWTTVDADEISDRVEARLDVLKVPRPRLVYRSRNGLRFVHELDRPASPEEHEAAIERLHAAYELAGLPVDPACKDWTRYYKLPRVEGSGSEPWFRLDEYVTGPIVVQEVAAPVSRPSPGRRPTVVSVGEGDPDEERALLETQGKGGVWKPTMAATRARKALTDASCRAWLYEGADLAEPGHRHDALLSAVGEVVARLHGAPWASPELAVAILSRAARTLSDDHAKEEAKVREMVSTFWGREEDKKGAMRAYVEERMRRETPEDAKATFLRGVREWFPGAADLSDPDLLVAIRAGRYGVAQDARRDIFHVLQPTGYYCDLPCGEKALPKVIEQAGMDWLVPTTYAKDDGRGNVAVVALPPKAIVSDSARVFMSTDFRFERSGTHLALDYERRDQLVLVPFRLRTDVPAEFSQDIWEHWRTLHWGDEARAEEALIAHAMLLLFEHGPTAACLNIGEANAGKTLLAKSMAMMISTGKLAPARALVDNFNSALLWSPIIHFEEGADRGSKGIDGGDALRRIVAGGDVQIEGKGKDQVPMQGVHRVLMTSNNEDILGRLIGDRSRTAADWRAIGERVAMFSIDPAASEWMTARNQDWKMSNEWMGTHASPGRYARFWSWVLAEMVQWDGGRPKKLGRRLLFEGNAAGRMVREMESTAVGVPEVVGALNRMVRTRKAEIEDGRVWFTMEQVVAEACRDTRLPAEEARKVVRTLTEGQQDERRTISGKRARWRSMEGVRLVELVEASGTPAPELEVFRQTT